MNRWVNTLELWDRDGPGPAGPVVVLGGKFWTAGNVACSQVATFDPQTGAWGALGNGLDGSFNGVAALAALPNGNVVAGGDFVTASGVPVNHLAVWDGSSWAALGGGTNGSVSCLLLRSNGDLVVGGSFTTTGGIANSYVATWNGAGWVGFPQTLNGPVTALAELPNGDLVAGGRFTLPTPGIARFDGTSWQPMGLGFTTLGIAGVTSLAVLPNGSVVAGGDIFQSGSTLLYNLARFTGSSWQPHTAIPVNHSVYSLRVMANGDLLVGGTPFCIAPGQAVGRWNGTAWTTYGPYAQSSDARCLLELPSGEIVAGGDFVEVAGQLIWNVRLWDGTAWRPLTSGSSGAFLTSCEDSSGHWIVGGGFALVEGQPVNRLAAWDGATWRGLGGAPNAAVFKVARSTGSDVIAAGGFTAIGGIAATYIARWDGNRWNSMAAPFDPLWAWPPDALLACSNGDVYLGGQYRTLGSNQTFGLFRCSGGSWSQLGFSSGQYVHALAELPNGDVVAGGVFGNVGGVALNSIGRWDGTTWHPLAQGVQGDVLALAVAGNGDLIVGGSLTTNGSVPAYAIARWDGNSWHAMGGTSTNFVVRGIEVLPGGHVLAGGNFPEAGYYHEGVCRWDGAAWSWVAKFDGVSADRFKAMTRMRNGTVHILGNFNLINGNLVSAFMVDWEPTCAAAATDVGGGCPGTAQALALATEEMPWLGASFEGAATGFASGALAASLFGLTSPSTPLQLWTPWAGQGCLVMASTESVSLVPVTAGAARSSLAVPNVPAYLGIDLYHQFVQLEPGAGSQSPRVSLSNGLHLTVGTY